MLKEMARGKRLGCIPGERSGKPDVRFHSADGGGTQVKINT